MTEMSETDIQERFDRLVETLDGKHKPVADLKTASELLDAQQRLFGEMGRLMRFWLDLKDSQHDIVIGMERVRLEVQQLNHALEKKQAEVREVQSSKDAAKASQLVEPLASLLHQLAALQDQSNVLGSRNEGLLAHGARIAEFSAELHQVEAGIRKRRLELGI